MKKNGCLPRVWKGLQLGVLVLGLAAQGCVPETAEAQPGEQVWMPGALTGKLPLGMNLDQLNYYDPSLVFMDVMTTASPMLTTNVGTHPWDSGQIQNIPRDANGYPLSLPVSTPDGQTTYVRFLVNNHYSGKYRIFFDGAGTLGGNAYSQGGAYYINLSGDGGNKWIDILTSQSGNPVRNMKILPGTYEASPGTCPVFNPQYLKGLEKFHALRFMDWFRTNGSDQVHWSDRVTKTTYTQGGSRGISQDYAIDLANALKADAWVNVPHKASDDYIRKMAQLWRDNFDSTKRIYLEYSNELWNWMFNQTSWVNDRAPGAVDAYVSADLAAIENAQGNYPEKDAYMMARVFRIWTQEFSGQTNRLVRVATGQAAWADNSDRILKYLFQTQADKAGCDALAHGGYFNFNEKNHQSWLQNPGRLTPGIMLDDTRPNLAAESDAWALQGGTLAKKYGVKYLVYEGGQHMQPWLQGNYPYNNMLYETQIHPKMYQLYLMNLNTHLKPEVDCQLFMAFAYVSERQSRYGSWGHLENLSQVDSNYAVTAPKFQALMDAVAPKP